MASSEGKKEQAKAAVMGTSIYGKFNLKTDDGKSTDGGTPRHGRIYDPSLAQKPGGLKAEEMLLGVKFAHLSCTDDSPGHLATPAPNTLEAVKLIVGGSEEEAKKPLSTILKDHFNLTMDCWIDESGVRKGRPVDTQGYIASNDEMIVLSYRFTTTMTDWMTNLSMTTSEWEPDVDEKIGHAGWCSCLDGYFTSILGIKEGKPRVHTGFYNNFLSSLPYVKKHIVEKLTAPNAKPMKVYVCGCSLGAAIATVATCYLLLELPLEDLPHKIISVTAGCPRVCAPKMKERMMERMKVLRPLDKAVICRLVYNEDVVPHIPFGVSGFRHLDKLVYITTEGDVIVGPYLEGAKKLNEVCNVVRTFWGKKKSEKEAAESMARQAEAEGKTPFEVELEKTPQPIKDHMPYWYMTHLSNLLKKEKEPKS